MHAAHETFPTLTNKVNREIIQPILRNTRVQTAKIRVEKFYKTIRKRLKDLALADKSVNPELNSLDQLMEEWGQDTGPMGKNTGAHDKKPHRNNDCLTRIASYYSENVYGSADFREIDELFNNFIFAEVLPPNAAKWGGKRIVDMSANNLAVSARIANLINDAMVHADAPKDAKVTLHINDIAYANETNEGQMQITPIGKNALEVAKKLEQDCPHIEVQIHSQDAATLTVENIGGPADIILDRLGALWYACDEGPDSVKRLLTKYKNLLSENGAIVADAYSGFPKPKHAPALSTIDKLVRTIGQGPDLTEFFDDLGLHLSISSDFQSFTHRLGDKIVGEPFKIKDTQNRIIVLRQRKPQSVT